jgi:hypothetical protein
VARIKAAQEKPRQAQRNRDAAAIKAPFAALGEMVAGTVPLIVDDIRAYLARLKGGRIDTVCE